MRETISIHVGQAGIRSGCSMWNLYSTEHGIRSDGTSNHTRTGNEFLNSFEEKQNGTFSPRCILIDLDGSSITEAQSKYCYFDSTSLVGGKEDTGNLFADGYFSHKDIMENVFDHIRKQAEKCSSFGAFQLHRNFGGGTGSGFGAQIQENLLVDYSKKFSIDCITSPYAPLGASIVELYNTTLAFHHTIDKFDANILFDNESLYENSLLYQQSATWDDINYLYSQTMSHLTTSARYAGSLSTDLSELSCLIVYPRISFYIPSLAPLNMQDTSTAGIMHSLFDHSNWLLKVHPRQGLFMKIWMIFRGDVQPRQVTPVIKDLKESGTPSFVSWAPVGFKVGVNEQPSVLKGPHKDCPRSAVMLSQTSGTSKFFIRLLATFDKLYAKRSFVHWYVGCGMEETEFMEARENIAAVIQDFKEVETDEDDL